MVVGERIGHIRALSHSFWRRLRLVVHRKYRKYSASAHVRYYSKLRETIRCRNCYIMEGSTVSRESMVWQRGCTSWPNWWEAP